MMKNNPLRLAILPILAIIIFAACSYLFSLAMISFTTSQLTPQFINPLKFLLSLFTQQTFTIVLPILLVILLFTMQYSLTTLNKKNILYILTTMVAAFIIKTILYVIILPNIFPIIVKLDNFFIIEPLIQMISITCRVIFIISIGLISHYYLIETNRDAQPININPTLNNHIIAAIYGLLILCIILSNKHIQYMVYRDIPSNSMELTVFFIANILMFVYFYSWAYQHLTSHTNQNYAINTIKTYSIALLCNITCGIVAIFIFFLAINTKFFGIIYVTALIISELYILFIIAFYIIAIMLIYTLGNKVNSKLYKLYHYILFISITMIAAYLGLENSFDKTIIVVGYFLFAASLAVWINYLITKFALNKSFR